MLLLPSKEGTKTKKLKVISHDKDFPTIGVRFIYSLDLWFLPRQFERLDTWRTIPTGAKSSWSQTATISLKGHMGLPWWSSG